jgi:hypothetical protein
MNHRTHREGTEQSRAEIKEQKLKMARSGISKSLVSDLCCLISASLCALWLGLIPLSGFETGVCGTGGGNPLTSAGRLNSVSGSSRSRLDIKLVHSMIEIVKSLRNGHRSRQRN